MGIFYILASIDLKRRALRVAAVMVVFYSCLRTIPAAAKGFEFDAGVAHIWVKGAYVNHVALEEKSSSRAFHVGASMDVSPVFSARLGISSLSTLRAVSASIEGNIPEDTSVPYSWWHESRIYVVTLSPRFRVFSSARFSIRVAPEINWVTDRRRGTLRDRFGVERPLRQTRETNHGLDLGAAITCRFQIRQTTGVEFTYRYMSLEPSWGRRANEVGIGLTFR